MSHEKPTTDDDPTEDTAIQAPQPPGEEQDEWPDEPLELPRRPRRRLLAPVPLILMGVLLIACGFIAGALVEKGQGPSGSSVAAASTLSSRFAALRGSASSGANAASGPAGAALAGRAGGFAGAGAGAATAGQVAYLSGSTLYVTTAEGNTVKVTTSPATSVTKTVKASVKSIHPGETVTATGATAANGAVSAASIRVGAGGGLGALFNGSGTAASKSQSSRTGGGEPALFGGGGG